MKPSKLLERFYLKVFIAVVVMRDSTDVFVQTRKHGKMLKKSLHTFDVSALDEEVTGYIAAAASQSPLHYIAVLNTLPYQGAVPTCSELQLPRFADVASCQIRCFDESWSVYASDESIYRLQESYKATGLDFIFSPFSLLRNYFDASVAAEPALYLLLGETFAVTAVFKEKRLLFGTYEPLAKECEPSRALDLDAEASASETARSDESCTQMPVEEGGAQGCFTLVMRALKSFYNDDRYEKVFIERVLMADASGAGDLLKEMLEDELFVGVERFEINLAEEVAALAVAEVEDEG